ncbi:probable arginine--tRNA ligase, cytoplasmic [Anopheles bellator]|uniref:probable arginine--tRNA ligase, cytoplasmic n=1 Tax=Anopheles bellator TaxID=139047 RepID=UPI002647571D|nr:probable arginine--tRNA ligase, cytoplasmic [Anopheles bellator]XP_058053954.1 probable arginine--tRNA ligase, cytoplasmic [Anopheles bellator]
MSDFNSASNQVRAMEKEVCILRSEIEDARKGIGLEEDNPELKKMMEENMKLQHRLAVLEAACEKICTQGGGSSTLPQGNSIIEQLQGLFTVAIRKAYPSVTVTTVITNCNVPKFGDYQFNSAMHIVQQLKQQSIKATPRDVAQNIKDALPSPVALIEKVEVSPAGFVNVFISKQYIEQQVMSLLKDGIRFPLLERKRVIVDFSSPNVAKEMHVGHLRSTIIGDSICRFLEFLGHDVLRINHIGDWGTQFGMLIAHLQDQFPNFQTVSPPIGDLQAFYKQSKVRFDSDAVFKKRAYECVVKLQSGEPSYLKAWNLICDVSRKEFQTIYNRLDVTLIERGESFYQSRMQSIVDELKAGGFLEEDDGRLIMWSEDRTGIPLTVVKSDGGFTYDTSDMAAIKQRLHEEKADWLIYVTDAGQATHFQTIFSCAKRAKILDAHKRVDHVGFGVVLGEDGKKFKTRSGDTVKLAELLDEGLKRSMNKLLEKERNLVLTPEELRDAQESVAYGCIKYADLSHNRNNEYVFSFDKMLEDKGNTAVYLLYAYTRIRSIARNCGGDFESNIQKVIDTATVKLDHEKEWKLAKALLRFTDVMLLITKNLSLHHLCEFAYEICTTFSEFYDSCYCIKKNKEGKIVEVYTSRVLLCEATARTLGKCFDILGLKPISKI